MLEQDNRDIQKESKEDLLLDVTGQKSFQNPQQGYQTQLFPIENRKLFSAIAYVPLLWLVGLLLCPNEAQVKFHANQGVILTLCIAGLYWAVSIVSQVFLSFTPMFVVISTLLNSLSGVASLGFMLIGVMHACTDTQQPLPLIGSLFTVVR